MTGPAPGPRPAGPPPAPRRACPRPLAASLDLPAVPAAVPAARHAARAAVLAWDRAALADDCETVTAELVTNAVRAAAAAAAPGTPAPVRLRLTTRADGILVRVWDASPRLPRPAPPDPAALAGRGLHIIAAIAARHGACPAPGGGKTTWALITPAPAVPPPRRPDYMAAARAELARRAMTEHPGWDITHTPRGWAATRPGLPQPLASSSLPGLAALISTQPPAPAAQSCSRAAPPASPRPGRPARHDTEAP